MEKSILHFLGAEGGTSVAVLKMLSSFSYSQI